MDGHEKKVPPRALKDASRAIRYSKEFGPTRALGRSIRMGEEYPDPSPRRKVALAIGAFVLVALAFAKIVGWF